MAADYKQMTIEDFKNGLYIEGMRVKNEELEILTAGAFHMFISNFERFEQIFSDGKCSFFPKDPKFGVNSCLYVNRIGKPLPNANDGIPTPLVDIALLQGKPQIAKILVEVYSAEPTDHYNKVIGKVEVYGAKPTNSYNKAIEKEATLASEEYIDKQKPRLIQAFDSALKNESKPMSGYTLFGKISEKGDQQEFKNSLKDTKSLADARDLVNKALKEQLHSRTFKSKVEAVGDKITELEQLQNGNRSSPQRK